MKILLMSTICTKDLFQAGLKELSRGNACATLIALEALEVKRMVVVDSVS